MQNLLRMSLSAFKLLTATGSLLCVPNKGSHISYSVLAVFSQLGLELDCFDKFSAVSNTTPPAHLNLLIPAVSIDGGATPETGHRLPQKASFVLNYTNPQS